MEMIGLRDCPVCGRPNPRPSVRRDAIPIFQNVTFATREEALAAPRGAFVLATCAHCGFSFNGTFDQSAIVYDENYDNHVASALFHDYYQGLANMLIERFGIRDGSVYDIGCGDGEFLQVLCSLAPGIRGIGIDPSCTPVERGNLRLIRSRFEPSTFAADTRLVILRHVLEHIGEPVEFMRQLRAAMPDAPLFVEVPDLDWILANAAFWDFCYEHCNYFTLPTLASALTHAGFAVEEQRSSFGDQYQWAICRPAGAADAPPGKAGEADKVAAYAAQEEGNILALARMAANSGGLVLWGMATKGVLLSNILPPGAILGGVDMNVAKQGRFVAGSGVEIHPPEWLAVQPGGHPVLVMNPNYADEIRGTVDALGADVVLRTA